VKILVACEYSGTVRDAFRRAGHDAWSCDLLPSDADPRWHIQGDALAVAYDGTWDLMVAHPPCTDLAVSGAPHFAAKIADGRQGRALDFVRALLNAPIPMIALENPVSVISSKIRKPDQIIHPWMFGHMEQKTTCLWLKGLPPLVETDNVRPAMMELPKNQRERLHYLPPGPNRWKERSKTFAGIAEAMASQWRGEPVQEQSDLFGEAA
jgi:site-specific DNA-cytosine methylase